MPNIVYISLGSNLQDREKNLHRAIQILDHSSFTVLMKISSLYETEPLIVRDQPEFLNAVAKLSTFLSPLGLLHYLKNIEKWMGRKPGIPKGPRLIDLDLLLYNDITLQTPELTIPHPQMLQRRFVLVPLLEIEPELSDPIGGIRLIDYLETTPLEGNIRLYPARNSHHHPVTPDPGL
ncbi:MAG: 2-amino-4-hydroxy-6-hydroxymethyldihydropteridine diphosphokinase [Candidatus Delongbacteria bacterium]|nr:2-amino-4-hydroxy-6-hydroxymethyldihydropteridine diphosphokinase [Candidatus Delongbacteria bacterium]